MIEWPVGFRAFHPVPAVNFELNRWLPLARESEIAAAAARIRSFPDWTREMLALAAAAEREGRELHASTYFRAAEFFLPFNDPQKKRCYDLYRAHFAAAARTVAHERGLAPFAGRVLPFLRFAATGERRDTVVIFGGFDSYMEEYFFWGAELAARGRDVVIFEGPGQGAPLREQGLTMSPDWAAPVAAILDRVGADACTLIGISLGGCLALRAAAFERRVKRVVAFDVLDDFFDCFAARLTSEIADQFRQALQNGDARGGNGLMERLVKNIPDLAWSLAHGMEVSGAPTPFDFLTWLQAMSTAAISGEVSQDVLLLAGAEDHIVPLRQLHRQAQALAKAKSVTTRLFTAADHTQNHCQVGNIALALDAIDHWLALQLRIEEQRAAAAPQAR
jgi:pimeloyl-ACP methyl ester carboxylesterase